MILECFEKKTGSHKFEAKCLILRSKFINLIHISWVLCGIPKRKMSYLIVSLHRTAFTELPISRESLIALLAEKKHLIEDFLFLNISQPAKVSELS